MAPMASVVVKAMMRISASSAGFTLLEILLVLAILGMASVLVVPNLGNLDIRTFGSQVRGATALLNYARRTAVVQGQPATVTFYSAGWSPAEDQPLRPVAGNWRAGEDTVIVYRDSTGQEQEIEEMLAISFFPEGGSTGGTLLLQQDQQVMAVTIDPFTGRVTLGELDE